MTIPPSLSKNILFCTDFSANAALAFDYALDAAVRREEAMLYLLHVIPEPESQFWRTYIYDADFNVDEKAKRDLDDKIDAEYISRIPAGIKFKVEFRIGKDYQKILEFADEVSADLIVIGKQGCSPLHNFIFGGVAERVVVRAKCPVLVVPLQ
ncbi:MAG: universal stress protein [Oligosphaeraceae bacterium]|jgi:nucleotide-binding universal stress UspA family protein|nr:universal stress protein [Oligosphaeraceae bacterium]